MAAIDVNPGAGPEPPAPANNPAVIALVGAAGGIILDRFRPLPPAAWWALAAAGFATWILLSRKRRHLTAAAALFIAMLALAATWHHCCWNVFENDDLGLFARNRQLPVCIEAVARETPRVVPEPEFNPLRPRRSGDEVRFEVQLLAIRDGDRWRSASGRAEMVVEGLVPDLAYGDRFRAFAHLLPPEHALNPGEVDRAELDRGHRITGHLRVSYPEAVSLIASGFTASPWKFLESLRVRGRQIFAKYLQPRQANLAAAVLLGLREQLDPEETEEFQLTGTVHLLVIAGLHLGILAGFAGFVLRRLLPWRWGLAAVAAFTIVYMLLVDAQPPVIRATVLIVAVCVAACFGRRTSGFNILAFAGLIVLGINPIDLFHVGPQLSFLCVAGLMALAPMLLGETRDPDVADPPSELEPQRIAKGAAGKLLLRLRRWLPAWLLPERHPAAIERLLDQQRPWTLRQLRRFRRFVWRFFWRLALVSAAIWVVTAPLVMAEFHIFNPIAVFINAAVWLPMAGALISGLALLVCGMISSPLAALCAVFCNGLLAAVEKIVHFGQGIPCGHAWVPGPAIWWLIGLYAAPAIFAAFPRVRPPVRWRLAILGAWTAAGVIVPWLVSDRHGLRCTFLSVGHGEAIVLELPDGRTVVYDAGRMAAPISCCRSVSGYLWSRGLMHIDAVILSHADSDHYNALPDLLKRFSVGTVYVSPVMFDEPNASLKYLREAIDRAKTPLRVLASGDRLSGGPGCTLEILHPPPHGLPSTSNANCIVVSAEYVGRRVFLPADLQSPGLDDVIAEQPLHCDILLVPHHGSRNNKPGEFSAWATPDWSVISADHRYDTTSTEAVYARRGQVLHTADTGAVTARIDEKGIRVDTFCSPSALPAGPMAGEEPEPP